jgi:uncharacterized linocin/CFP29 family protein
LAEVDLASRELDAAEADLAAGEPARGGDYELRLGSDLSIGYLSRDADTVQLYFPLVPDGPISRLTRELVCVPISA